MKKLTALLFAVIMATTPIAAHADDVATRSEEIISMNHEDWTLENRTRPEQLCSDIFRATVSFKPTRVVAKANRNSITVTADLNTAVRVIIIEYSYDDRFWWSEQRIYRNVKYKGPVLVTNAYQQKYNYDRKRYSSSSLLRFTQGKTLLWKKQIYHPNDQWGYLEATQPRVDAVRNKIKFRKSFQIPNVWDCRDEYYVRITYIYTSATNGRNLRSDSTTVRVR